MSHSVLFTEEAESDLANFADYIAEDNPRRARTVADERQVFVTDKLSTFLVSGPEIGLRRFVVFGNDVILYRIDEAARIVLIEAIVEGHRNWREAFGSSA
ncbi:type II toxin-antitoxin system RelE/ParE family toxin [Aquibium carbonis]|uniref:Type II toxin-antitoxin system RelE/ParE family toxin n=1 Tax=Aquibium carbonis TaxID=2495581 RepID=A0A3R9ZYL8_9HYPH|nr:type II toxin-antitoxin system RelE/ParE family toxin [Aquibium carbonis]RST84808.1 type II toxin-antitoxin system RelE/ParE family toxin [Aquibium carbonis]